MSTHDNPPRKPTTSVKGGIGERIVRSGFAAGRLQGLVARSKKVTAAHWGAAFRKIKVPFEVQAAESQATPSRLRCASPLKVCFYARTFY